MTSFSLFAVSNFTSSARVDFMSSSHCPKYLEYTCLSSFSIFSVRVSQRSNLLLNFISSIFLFVSSVTAGISGSFGRVSSIFSIDSNTNGSQFCPMSALMRVSTVVKLVICCALFPADSNTNPCRSGSAPRNFSFFTNRLLNWF